MVLDVTEEASVKASINYMKKHNKRLDILVNSAAKQVFSHFSIRSKKDFMDVCGVNIYGTFNCIQKFSDFMIEKDVNGCIINIGSVYGIVSGDPRVYTDSNRNTSEVYGASKAAIIQMTKYFSVHLAQYNIRVNSISPGGVFNNQGNDFVKNYSYKTPSGRMANAEEISQAVLFLADEKQSSYINGHNLVVDGGFTAW